MGDNIGIDWSLQKPNAFIDGFKNVQSMQDDTLARQARDAVLANPGDANALAKYAMFDPQGAQAVQGQLDVQRAARARAASADAFRGYQPINSFAPAVPAPVAPVAPAQSQSATMATPTPQQPNAAPVGATAAPAAPAPVVHGAAPAPAQQPGPLQDPMHPVAVAVGQAAAQGRVTPQEALARVAQDDPAQAQQLVTTFASMDTQARARAADSAESLGSAAQTLLSVPQSQRAAMLAQMAPQLAQHGIGPQQIHQAVQSGLTDDFLHGVVGQALGTQGLVTHADKLVEQQQTQEQIALRKQEIAQTGKYQDWQMRKGEAVPYGTPVVNPVTGQVIYNGDPQSAPTRYTGGWTPRAANGGDNPDPVVDNKIAGAAKFLGVDPNADLSKLSPMRIAQAMTLSEGGSGSLADRNNNPANLRNPDGTYKTFPTKQAGLQAAADLVQRKLANGQTTVKTLIEGLPVGGSGGGGAFEGQAQAIARGDAAPLTGRAAATGVGSQVMRRVYELNPEYDAKNYNPAVASLKSFTSGKDSQTVQALNNVTNHIAALRALAQAQGNGNVPAFNAAANWWAKQTGQPAPTNFDAAKQIIAGEIVKAIAGAGGGEGDRQTASQTLSGAQSPAQINGALDTIQGLVGSQVHTLQQKYEQGTGRHDFPRFLSDVVRKGFNIGGSDYGKADGGPVAGGFKVTRVN